MADVNAKAAKMANKLPEKSIDKAAYTKVKLDGRGIIAPTAEITSVDENPNMGPTPPKLELQSTGSNFFLLAALGVGAYFAFKK